MKKIKKAIAIVLSLAMMCTAVPASVLATINNNTAATTEEVVVDDETESEAASENDAEEETEALDESSSEETAEASAGNNDESETSSESAAEESSESSAEEETESDDEASQTVYEYEDDDISVTITLSDASDLPDGAEITVTELTGNELLECVEQLNEAADIGQDSVQMLFTSDDVFAYDISVVYDGEETEPEDEVEVCIEYSDDVLASIGAEDAQDIEIEHITDDGTVEDINTDADENCVTFTTNSFSTYAGTVSLTNTGIEIDYSSLGVAKNPIMYYQKINGYIVFCASPFANNHSHTGDKVYYLGTSSSYKNTSTSNNYQNYINISNLKATLSKVMQAYNDHKFYSGSYGSYSEDYINYVIAQAYIWGYIYRGATGTNVITSMISLALQQVIGLSASDASNTAQYVDAALSSYSSRTVYIYRVLSDSDCSYSTYYDAEDHQYLISLYYIVTQQTYTGYLNIQKASDNTSITSSNSLYSLEGAKYKVYSSKNDAESDTDSLHTFTISSDGSSNGAVELATGTYYVKETTAGTGYELDDTIYTVTVVADSTTYVNAGTVYDTPIADTISILLYKKSSDSSAGLEGAVYKVSYYTNYSTSGTAAAVWYLETDSDGKICLSSSYLASGYTSSSFYYDSDGNVTLPLGSISVQEVEAPTGYVIDETVYTATIKSSSSSSTGALITWSTGNSLTATNVSSYTADNQYATHSDSSIKGGVKFKKVDEDSSEASAQGDASLEGAEITIYNNSTDSVYVNGEWYSKGEAVLTLTTDSDGYAETDSDALPYGSYYAKETKASTGYTVDTDWIVYFSIEEDGTIVDCTGTAIEEPVIRGGVSFQKVDEDSSEASAQGDASLEGAEITIYNNSTDSVYVNGEWYSKGEAVLTLTTDSDGYAETDSDALPYGSYYALETSASTGYLTDSDWKATFSITSDGTTVKYTTTVDEPVTRGGVEIQKRDEETDAADALAAATLEGFVFAIINSSDESVYVDGEWYEPGETVYTLVTNENGYATTDLDGDGTDDTLPYGTYTISEISAGAGYTLTGTTEQTFEIREDGTVVDMTGVDDSIRNYVNRTDFEVTKKDGVFEALSGVLFQITSRTTGETHFFVTDENGSFSSLFTEDEEENANLNDDAISYTEVEDWYETVDAGGNTIWVNEDALSSDYGIWFGQYDIDSDGDTVDGMTETDASLGGSLIYDEYEIYEVVTSVNEEYFTDKDSDLTFQFSTEDYADGEETDLGTIWNTSMSMSTLVRNQNTGTQTAAAEDGIMIVDDIVVTGTDEGEIYYIRAWLVTEDGEQLGDYYYESSFTGDGTSSQEIANAIVFEDVDLTGLDGESVIVFAEIWNMEDTSDDDAVCMCFSKDLDNAEETIYIYGVSTEAVDTKNGTHTATSGDTVTITEEISYTNILPGEYYTLVAVLYDANTGEAITDDEGNVLSASAQIYAADSSLSNDGSVALTEGSATVKFEADVSDIESLVVYAYLYDMQYYANIAADGKTEVGNLLASEEEQTNAGETVHLANAYTKAADYYTGDEVGIIDEDGIAMITDTVYFENLSVGETYKITAAVVDKDTAEEISASGEIEFTIDEDGNVYDTAVEVTEIRDDAGINGNAEVTITVSGIDGRDAVVAYEVLYVLGTDGEWYEAAEHEDIDDADQTIHYPWVKTSAADSSTEDSVGVSAEDSALVDTVSFGNLSVGKTYYITGTIYNRTDNEKILDDDGEQVSATVTLTIDEEGNASISDGEEVNVTLSDNGQTVDGTLTVTFGFDSTDYSGDTVVVYEVIEHNGYTVASHESMDDDDQSVHYPDIDTSAIDADTGSHVGSIWGKLVNAIKTLFGATDADGNGIDDDKQQNITDTVELYNLVIGETYTVTGILYDQGTGDPLTIDGESITASAVIEVTESGITIVSGDASNPTSQSDDSDGSINGTIDMTYSFDSSLLDNEPTTIVVFETLYHASYAVAVHDDIDDDEQSVNDVSITTSAVDSETGDQIGTVAETSVIIDTVTMEKLVLGEEYTVKGYLIDAEATTEDEVVYIYDSDGSIVTSSLTFTASEDDEGFEMDTSDSLSANGSVLLEFSFSNELVQGKTVTVYEELYYNGVLIAVHGFTYDDDGDLIPESEQCVYYPTGKTNALDEETDAHISDTDTVTTITDMVYFQNLIIGNEYTITGTLHYAEDFIAADGTRYFAGDEVIDEEGDVYTSSVTFTASASIEGAEDIVVTTLADGTEAVSGYIPITFEISTADLSGATIVAFEEFYHNDVKVFVHADITDTPQIIKIPAISTSAYSNGIKEVSSRTYDSETGEYSWNVITITDTVSYWNLWTQSELDEMAEEALTIEDGAVADTRSGEIYSISEYATYIAAGYLVYADTGEPVYDTDGNMVTAYTVFSPEDEDGTVEVVYTIDFSKFVDEDGFNYLENKDLVVFEDLYHVNSGVDDADIDDITEDDHIAEHHDENDEEQTISVPKVTTDLKDSADDDDDALACEDITLIDVVSYENLTPGYEYTVTGTLYDQETGEPILDDDGDEITAEATFIPEESNGTVELSFTFSGVSLAGKSIVAFEEVFHEGKSVAVHADIEAEPQTVYIPKIGTSLKDSIDSEADALACEDITLIDTVSYENLLPGREYTVTGTLYDQETGEPILDDGGNEITAQTTFTPEEADGTVEVVFTFSGVSFAGKSLVAFEELYRDEKLVAVHADINDEEQTVYIPDGHTTLLSDEGYKLVLASEEITLIDRVYYENLIIGKTYTVTGTLYDKETGEPMLDDDGNEITALASFTAEDSDGYVDVTFTFSGVSLAGKSVVAFEEMYNENGKAVFVHADIDDEDQTVYIPKIKTMAADPNGYKYVTSAADGTVIDTVTYEDLIAGEEYTVYGVLMGKETGEAITDSEGNEITASAVFTAEDTSGTVELTFMIPAGTFTGAAVAFEELYLNSTLIAEHKDIDDEDQTVYFPEIGTYLADAEGEKDLDAYGEITLIDTVSYSDLEDGSTYRLVCVLMDKATGEAAIDADGNEITGETVFTAETTDGTVEVELTFTSDGMDGEYVAFETLYLVDEEGNDTIYASHADLDDEDQTVTLTVTPQTGDSSNVPFWIAVWIAAIACIACGVFIIVRKRRKKTR